MTGEPKPDAQRAIAFVEWLNPGAQIHLESMASREAAKPIARQYGVAGKAAAINFVEAENAEGTERNMYFLPNAEFLQGARKKEKLSAVRFLHVDLDAVPWIGVAGADRHRDARRGPA